MVFPYQSSAIEVPEGDAGIERTLATMDRFMDRAAASPAFIQSAQAVARTVPARDEDAQARAMLNWVRAKTHYVHDPVGIEVVKDPDYMLREIAESGRAVGDCDDFVVLLGALLRAIGIDAQPVVVAPDAGTYTHVLLRYRSPTTGWVTLDPITRNAPGWFPMGAARVGVFSNGRIDPSSAVTVQGLSGYASPVAPQRPVSLEELVQQTAPRLEPWNTMMWFGLGLFVLYRWARTGRIPV